MTLRSSFFNSVGGDRIYDASNFASYFASFIGNGVFPNPSNNLQVVAVSGNVLRVAVSVGKGFINGYYAENDAPLELQLTPADGALNRIDRIILGLNITDRLITAYVKTGVASSSPVAPALTRSGGVYELSLAEVRINNNTNYISQANITDTRPNSDVCGFVTSTVSQVDTSTLFLQYQQAFNDFSTEQEQNFADFLARIEAQLDGNTAGNLQNQINTKANINSPTFTGTVSVPLPAVASDGPQAASTSWVNRAIKSVINDFQLTASGSPIWLRIGTLSNASGIVISKLSVLLTGLGSNTSNSYDNALISCSTRGNNTNMRVQLLSNNTASAGNQPRYGYVNNASTGNTEFYVVIPNFSYAINALRLGVAGGAYDLSTTLNSEPTGIIYLNPRNIVSSQETGNLSSLLTTDKSNLVGSINELFTSVSNGKNSIATAITSKGVPSQGSDTFAQLATNINNIQTGVRFASGNATVSSTNLFFTRTLPTTASVERLYVDVSGLSFFPNRILITAPNEIFTVDFEGITRDPTRRVISSGNSGSNQYEVISQQGNVMISSTSFRLPIPSAATAGQSVRWIAYQ